jgi:hypothetical protein
MSFIACKQEPSSKQLTSLRIVPLIGQRGEVYIYRTMLEEMFVGYRFAIQ